LPSIEENRQGKDSAADELGRIAHIVAATIMKVSTEGRNGPKRKSPRADEGPVRIRATLCASITLPGYLASEGVAGLLATIGVAGITAPCTTSCP
jgi:hypothetical protein